MTRVGRLHAGLRYAVLLTTLALAQGCAKQEGEQGNMLDLADQPAQIAARADPIAAGETERPSAGPNAFDVMAVARALATLRGADPVELGRFCDDNARAFPSQADVHACKSLAGSVVALVPVPTSIEEMAKIADTLPVKDRAVFCTSPGVLKLTRTAEEYDRCFPPSVRAEFEALGGMDSIDGDETPVTQDELKEQVMRDAGRMTEVQRKLYCNVPGVRNTMEGESQACLVAQRPREAAEQPLTDDDPRYRDEGH